MNSQTGKISSFFCFLMVLGLSQPAQAMSSKMRAWLKGMAPQERMIQLCNMQAMDKLNADRLVDYTFSMPQINASSVTADGAAYRLKGQWYRVSYSCKTNTEAMKVLKLSLKKGQKIPEADWSAHNLFN